jgi:hypothetical protein
MVKTISPLQPASKQRSRSKWHSFLTQSTTRPSSLHLKDRQRRGLERKREKVRPIMILAKVAACRAHCSTHAVVFTAVASAAMAKVAINNIHNAMKALRRVPGRPGDPAHASPVASLAIRLRTAKQTLQRVPPPLHQSKCHL